MLLDVEGCVVKATDLSDEHFKDEDAEAPPVDGTGVRRFGEHFRRQEFRSSAEGARPVAEAHPFLAQTKIGDFHVTLRVQQQIIQLQISKYIQMIDSVIIMKNNCTDELGTKEVNDRRRMKPRRK